MIVIIIIIDVVYAITSSYHLYCVHDPELDSPSG